MHLLIGWTWDLPTFTNPWRPRNGQLQSPAQMQSPIITKHHSSGAPNEREASNKEALWFCRQLLQRSIPCKFWSPPRPSLPVFPTLFLSFTFADLSICQARSSLKTFALGIPSTCNLLAPNFYMIFSLTSLGLCLKVIFSDHSFHYMPLPPPLSSTPPSFIFLYGIELYLALDYIFTCVLSIRRGILFYSWLCHQHLGHSQAHSMCSVFDK